GDGDKLFVQQAGGQFVFKSMLPGKNSTYESTCGTFFDEDGDGDLDLVIGAGGNEIQNAQQNFTIRFYRNDGRGNFTPDNRALPGLIGNFATIEAADYDRDGDTDLFFGARCVPGNYGLPARSYLLNHNQKEWMDVSLPSLGNVGMVTDAAWADADHD